MKDQAWNHWVQGLGKKPVRDEVLEGLDQICISREDAKKINDRCREVAKEDEDENEPGQSPKHQIEIQLPFGDWGEACKQVGLHGHDSVRTGHLLAALIIESKSWKQVGNDEAEYTSGFYQDSLAFLLATKSAGLSLGSQERLIAWIVAAAAVVGALTGLASAIAAWYSR